MRVNYSNPHQKAAYDKLCALADSAKAYRLDANRSQRQVAKDAGMTQSSISRFESHQFTKREVWFFAYLSSIGIEVNE